MSTTRFGRLERLAYEVLGLVATVNDAELDADLHVDLTTAIFRLERDVEHIKASLARAGATARSW